MAACRLPEEEGGREKTFLEQEELSTGNILNIPAIYIYLFSKKKREKRVFSLPKG